MEPPWQRRTRRRKGAGPEGTSAVPSLDIVRGLFVLWDKEQLIGGPVLRSGLYRGIGII